MTSTLELAKLTAHLKTSHHNRRPRIPTLDTKLLLLPAHISPCALSVALEYHTLSFPPPTPLTHAPRSTLQTTPNQCCSGLIQPRPPYRPPNPHPHDPPPHRPAPPLRLASHPPLHLLSTRPLPPCHRHHPMPLLHPVPSPRKPRPPHRPAHPSPLSRNLALQPSSYLQSRSSYHETLAHLIPLLARRRSLRYLPPPA